MSAPGAAAPAMDILAYCAAHAAKCDDEGLHTRAIVLREAAAEIERLRSSLELASALALGYAASRESAHRESSAARFPVTYCSQCGNAFGPGDHGFSHCKNHKGKRSLTSREEFAARMNLDHAADLRADR